MFEHRILPFIHDHSFSPPPPPPPHNDRVCDHNAMQASVPTRENFPLHHWGGVMPVNNTSEELTSVAELETVRILRCYNNLILHHKITTLQLIHFHAFCN